MFMNGAMLGRAFAITSDRRYADMLTRSLLDAHVQQDDGLFWHCRSAPYYWGRGNGFAAMGFAETLTYLPEDHPDRDALLDIHRRHLSALGRLQCASGMFRQVLDFPGSYEELTATCMVGYAVARGLRRGWLDPSYMEMLELCWRAASERVQDDGAIVDGCAGTGVQSSLREYLDRPAIHGLDDRTGSMALWFATEMERLRREA
jgi:rhamnogalacturonyl hydrolase YesR